MKKSLLCLVAMLFTVAGSPQAFGLEERSVRPGVNRSYEQPNYQEWVKSFESPGREVYDKRLDIVAATKVKPGMVVADVGAGTGLFTYLFAQWVGPEGKVYAVDISRTFIDNIQRRAREAGVRNITGIVNSPHATGLPPDSVDLVFTSDTYHHFEYPQSMLRSIHQALRPGGTLVIVDFERKPGVSSSWVMGHVRAGKEAVTREVEAAGFKLVEDKHFLRENYFMRFVKQP